MFREIILPIFRSIRLCVTACGIMHPMLPATGRQYRGCIILQAVTHSLVLLKMGKIIALNMLRWLELLISRYCCIYLVGCLYYLYQWCTVKQISDNEIYLLIKYIKSVLWRVSKCLSYIEEAWCLKVKGCPILTVDFVHCVPNLHLSHKMKTNSMQNFQSLCFLLQNFLFCEIRSVSSSL